MKYSIVTFLKLPFFVILFFCALSVCTISNAMAAKREVYDIIYIRTNDLEKVLDYKEDLESVFDRNVLKKLKIVGRGDEFALIYDGNLSSRTVARTLIKHAELLNNAGFDEPYAIKEQIFDQLYNVSYGMGPNLDPLKEKYQILYNSLGEDVKRDLFIEQTDYGNYILVYRLRGDEASTLQVARRHADLLKRKKITTSLARENNNTVVYGESSLIDDGSVEKPAVEELAAESSGNRTAVQKISAAAEKKSIPVGPPQKIVATAKVVKEKLAADPLGSPANSTKFEQSIEDYIENLKRKGRLGSDESMGWMVYDLEQDRRVVGINADMDFQAASMIKPFVALAYFHQVKEKKLGYGAKSKKQMEAMIQRSSNSATNWVMKQVGGPVQCEAILKQYYKSIFKKTAIKEYIPAGGRTYLNSAPPSDYVRFLRALWNEELPYGKEIRRLMALPGRDRLYYGTPIPKGTLVYNKTGSTARLCGDMGILVPKTKKGERYPYAIVGIIERRSRASNYGQWMHSRGRVIRDISTMVYEELKKEHQLM